MEIKELNKRLDDLYKEKEINMALWIDARNNQDKKREALDDTLNEIYDIERKIKELSPKNCIDCSLHQTPRCQHANGSLLKCNDFDPMPF